MKNILNSWILDIILICMLCIVIYANSLHGDFVYDDYETIVKNPYIKNLKYIPDYFDLNKRETWSFHESQHGLYRPVLLLSFAINYYLSGLDTFSYHILNLILHIINSLLVYQLIFRISQMFGMFEIYKIQNIRIPAIIGAMMFASHPLQTESVSYIVSRSSLLSTVFILGAFNMFLCAIEKRWNYTALVFSLFLFILGLFTKEIVITLPLLILTFFLIYIVPREEKKRWIVSIQISLMYFLILLAYLIPRIILFDKSALSEKQQILGYYFLSALKALFIYLKLLIIPVGQTVDHNLQLVKSYSDPFAILAFIAFAAFVVIAFTVIRRFSKVILFFILWFIIALLPNLVLPTLEPISEHTAYFPSIGFFGVAGFSMAIMFERYKRYNKYVSILGYGIFCILILQLGFLTVHRNIVWRNDLELWSDAVQKTPEKERPHINLGNAYQSFGKLDMAIREYETALRIMPQSINAINNLGMVWAKTGKYEAAEKAFTEAIALKPFNPEAYNNIGLMYILTGRYKDAIKPLEKAVSLRPNDAVAWANLGIAYMKTENVIKACTYFEKAVIINPDDPMAVNLYRKFCSHNTSAG